MSMRIFIKNKKFLFALILFIFLFLSLSVFWGKAASDDCKSNCEKCTQAECGEDEIKAICTWEPTLTTPTCCDKLEIGWPNSPMGTSLNGCSVLPAMIRYIYEWGIVLGGLVAFIALIMAGFQYLTSVGDPSKMKEAQGQIISAIFGLILLLGSWLVLNTINPALTTFYDIPFNPREMTFVEPNFGFGETKPCDFAFLWRNIDYGGGAQADDILISDTHRKGGFSKSVKSFITCDLCDPCTTEEVAREQALIDQGLLDPNDRICIDPDGDAIFYNKNTCESPEGNSTYYPIKDECEKQLLYLSGEAYCIENGGTLDCQAYYKKGGSCTLQYFGGGFWPWEGGCFEKIGETYAVHPNLTKLTDREITCVKLIKHIPGEY